LTIGELNYKLLKLLRSKFEKKKKII